MNTTVHDQLRVFIGSSMAEFRDVREYVAKALGDRGIKAFVYETAAGARPDTILETSLREVKTSDVFIGLFAQKFPAVTTQEFQEARSLKIPCFVYVRDKDATREPELERFLSSEVYHLQKGVSYAFFHSGLTVADQIANDIQSWLVRRHRELTADRDTNRVPGDDFTRLEDEIRSIQSAMRDSLPTGTAADRLARDLRGWFQTLGYRIEEKEPRELEQRARAFSWVINVPKRRGYDRILIRGIEGEAGLADLKRLEESVAQERTDEGWLVTPQRLGEAVSRTVAVQDQPRLFCYTVDELLDEVADFTGYLDWLENEVRSRGIDRVYVPLAATKDEIDRATGDYLGRSRYDAKNGWLDGYIDRWLDDPSKEHVSVLGEFGTGKTWFSFHYAWLALERYRQAKERSCTRPRLPLVIPLREYAKAVSVESLFSEFFFRKHEIPLPGYSAFEQLNRMGKLLLIFDGFDEMAAKVSREQMINNFWELARVVVPGSKAILTCRTEHFPEAKEGRAILGAALKASTAALTGESPQFEVLELEQFDAAQIRELLENRTNSHTADVVMRSPKLLELARRPVMTEMILEALPDIKAGKPADLSRIYFYAAVRKMERDIESGRTFTSLADKLYFLCEIAWEMLSTDRVSLNYRKFPERLANLFGDMVREEKDLDHWRYDMLRNSMLVRNADGDYMPAHRSLLEFFVAYKFAAELGLLAPDFIDAAQSQSNIDPQLEARDYTWDTYFDREMDNDANVRQKAPLRNFDREPFARLAETFGRIPITAAVVDLMENMFFQTDSVVNSLVSLARLTSQGSTSSGFIGGNAVSLLLRLKPAALKGVSLSGAQLDNANFADADLTGCSLKAASLCKATFLGTTLENVDLRNAIVSGASFSDVRHVTSVAVSPDGQYYAGGHDDGSFKLYETKTGSELLHMRPHSGRINALRWSPDGACIASGSADGSLGMWRMLDGSEMFFEQKAYTLEVGDLAFDQSRNRIVTVGGVEGAPVKTWSLQGKCLARYPAPGDHTSRISIAHDGKYMLVSYLNRDRFLAPGMALFEMQNDGAVTLVKDFEATWWPMGAFLFGCKSSVFFANDPLKGICLYAAGAHRIVKWIRAEGIPKGVTPGDELLAVVAGEQIEVWHIRSDLCLATLRFGARNRIGMGPRGGSIEQLFPKVSRFRSCDVCFSPAGDFLVGGADDGTMRLWDTRLFVRRNHQLRNPHFGKMLRLQQHKLVCTGLRLHGTQGLASVTISGEETEGTEKSTIKRIREWFRIRGAKI